MRRLALACLILILAAPLGAVSLKLETVVENLESPVGFECAPKDPSRFYVLEQEGRIRIIRDGRLIDRPFLDLSARTRVRHTEQGLLGLAFHPEFARNRKFYTHYTDRNGDTVISQWTARSSDEADPGSERIILTQDQPYANHNGGQISFGPDGYLYISLGDGGAGGDPHNNGQRLDTFLGKILRIDVDSKFPYAIPKDNPFVGKAGAKPEIWASGLRNGWRFSFDPAAGLLYIGDVGQNRMEEIDVENLAEGGGKNYGWNIREGTRAFRQRKPAGPLAEPALAYDQDEGRCSVTGGYVYAGKSIPDLRGHYFYGDFCSGDVWSFLYKPGVRAHPQRWTEQLQPAGERLAMSSFGRDLNGELYLADYVSGTIYKIVPAP